MKLSAHYNKASIIITIIVLIAGGIIYFFAISHIARNQLDRDLTEELEEVVTYVNQNGKLPKQIEFDEDQTSFVKTNQKSLPARFFDTVYTDAKERVNEPGRAVSGPIALNGEHYMTTIIESRQSAEYLVQIITLITLVLMIGLIIILFITNRYILNGLWKPFYETLSELKVFNIADTKSLNLKHNKVNEFNDLNNVVQLMSSRVKNDYEHLKGFTENASHEMMTPLAVITAKLDTLIQDESLKANHYDQINDIYAATNKLSKLNHSLLLLVKIENNLIEDGELLRLDLLIVQKFRQFSELITSKNIAVMQKLEEKEVFASKYLVDILLNNLFSNAIRHNIDDGLLLVTITSGKLIFQNNGSETPLNADHLFERFQKGKQSDGTGLGLTIVKNICQLYGWNITYRYGNPLHIFQIDF